MGRATGALRVRVRTTSSMHRSSRLSRWPAASIVVVAVLAACSSEPDADTEVAGVVLERGSGQDEHPAGPQEAAGEPGELAEPPAEADGEVPRALSLLRSGPVSVGTVWLSAAGEWVGLDGQLLEPDDVADPVHLNALVETDGDQTRLLGCEVRIVAPEDAELQGDGMFTVETVVEHTSGEPTRTPLDPFEVELTLAPGQDLSLDVDGAETAIELDVDRDRQVRCEGRFDRT